MNETKFKIRTYGNPVLRKKAKPVKGIGSTERDILSMMSRIMYEASGIGLAASQIGISLAMIVVDVGSGLYKLINPKIAKKIGSQVLEEGCLSVPDVYIKVKRAKKIIVKALDEFGKPVTVEAQDLLACVFQHEIDHLKGKLIVDYASFFEKITLKKKLEGLIKRSKDERLPEEESKSCKLQL